MNNILLFIYGASLASFGFCTGQRLENGTSLWVKRSFCDHCHQNLSWWQLIPVLGWCLQKGHCHFCGASISAASVKLELGYGVLFSLLGPTPTDKNLLLFSLLHLWLLILATEDQASLCVTTPLLYGGALVLCVLDAEQFLFFLQLEWPQTLALACLFFLLEAWGQFGRADTICLLVLQLLFGLRFCSWVLLVSALLFCLVNLHAPLHQPHPFLPSLTTATALVSLLSSLVPFFN